MNDLKVSVVVVSFDRPDDLALCLKALTFQYRRNFEIIVVHNLGSKPGVEITGLGTEIKTVAFERPNISAARNLGIAAASGDLIAFIDDDAIAEPTWLKRLCEPFVDPNIAACGGFVIGRNGFDIQWAGETVDDYGDATQFNLAETTIIEPKPNAYAKTHGTNCAFRASVLEDQGGFDENFHFYLDETDLNIRIGKAGLAVAIVPNAEVHHSFSKSKYRSQSRAPKSLFEVGASTAYFLKKHDLAETYLAKVVIAQRQRLNRMVVSGKLEPRDASRLLGTLEKGFITGGDRVLSVQKLTKSRRDFFNEFRPYSAPSEAIFSFCRRIQSKQTLKNAARDANEGKVMTVLVFSWTSLRHKRTFHRNGFWLQTGGLFGKSERSQKAFQLRGLANRAQEEIENLKGKREI